MAQSIYIREITKNDTENILRWRNSPSVSENFIYRTPLTKEDHENWLSTKVFSGKVAQFIIEEKENNRPMGSVYLRDIDPIHKKAEFGIFIGEEAARGKGYGTQATLLALEQAFEKLDLNKVYLRVFAKNKRAVNCYRKAGFTEEGLFREDVWIDGIPYDMIFMGILKSQWKGNTEYD